MSSFFTKPSAQRKRKRPGSENSTIPKSKSNQDRTTTSRDAKSQKSRKPVDDEDISSESDLDNDRLGDESDEDEFADETPAEKRLRLGQQYLDNLRKETGTSSKCWFRSLKLINEKLQRKWASMQKISTEIW